jgi:transposase
VFVDEAGFYLLPMVVKTYAPCGQTPILRVPLTRDHLSAISGITPDGKLFMIVQDMAFDGAAIVRFLCHLLRHISGNLLLIWDGLPAHHGQAVKDFLAQGAAHRLHLEPLPGYAPELNPDEGVWHYLKSVQLRNLCCHDLAELRLALRRATWRLRQKVHSLVGCFAQVHLGVQL